MSSETKIETTYRCDRCGFFTVVNGYDPPKGWVTLKVERALPSAIVPFMFLDVSGSAEPLVSKQVCAECGDKVLAIVTGGFQGSARA